MLNRSGAGPIINVTGTSDVTIENLEIADAATDVGVMCSAGPSTTVNVVKATLSGNSDGIYTASCTVNARQSAFLSNTDAAAKLSNSPATFDACTVVGNNDGLELDGGVYTVTNTFIARNSSATILVHGINLFSSSLGNHIEFNTIVDNGGIGINCNIIDASPSFTNNIIARNTSTQTQGTACTYPNSIIVDTDISALKFKSPDTVPYDYHLMPGSLAIDMGTVSSIDHDYDGDHRPMGAGYDIGADEVQ